MVLPFFMQNTHQGGLRMQKIKALKVIGLDENRSCIAGEMPHIELFFRINEQPPKAWCLLFNEVMKNSKYPVKIKPGKADIVETWVRNAGEIEKTLKVIQLAFKRCSDEYISNIELQRN